MEKQPGLRDIAETLKTLPQYDRSWVHFLTSGKATQLGNPTSYLSQSRCFFRWLVGLMYETV